MATKLPTSNSIRRHFFKCFVSLTGGFGDWLIDLMSDIGLADFMSAIPRKGLQREVGDL